MRHTVSLLTLLSLLLVAPDSIVSPVAAQSWKNGQMNRQFNQQNQWQQRQQSSQQLAQQRAQQEAARRAAEQAKLAAQRAQQQAKQASEAAKAKAEQARKQSEQAALQARTQATTQAQKQLREQQQRELREQQTRKSQADRRKQEQEKKRKAQQRTTVLALAISRAQLRASLSKIPPAANDNRGVRQPAANDNQAVAPRKGNGSGGQPPKRPSLSHTFSRAKDKTFSNENTEQAVLNWHKPHKYLNSTVTPLRHIKDRHTIGGSFWKEKFRKLEQGNRENQIRQIVAAENTSMFSQGTTDKQIKSLVKIAVSKSVTRAAPNESQKIVYDFKRKIGYDRKGKPTSKIEVRLWEGEIRSAFPVE